MKTERAPSCCWSRRVNSLLWCSSYLPVALCVFIGWRRWKWDTSHRYDKVSVAALFDARVRERKKESRPCSMKCRLSLTICLSPFLIFSSLLVLFAFLHFFSPSLTLRVIFSLSLLYAFWWLWPFKGLYPSRVLRKYTLSHLQFHALEPLYLCAWWLLRELILILVRTVSEWDRDTLLEGERELQEGATPET